MLNWERVLLKDFLKINYFRLLYYRLIEIKSTIIFKII